MNDLEYMELALLEAKKAYNKKEVPVGCIIVLNDKIIARSYNKREKNHDCLGHAEIRAIKKATKKIKRWSLDEATMYITLEPCLMCAGAILQSRIRKVVYAAKEPKFGCLGSVCNVFENKRFNHEVIVTSGVLEEESSKLIKDFFKKIRSK